MINFNGNDAVTLSQGTTVIDQIGVVGMPAPMAAWAVCGVATGTMDNILIRKGTVVSPTTDWAMSAGTNTNDCQWTVLPATSEALMLMNNTMGAHALSP